MSMDPGARGDAQPLRLVGPSPEPDAAPFPIVGIGASAGGLDAVTQLLRNLPDRPGMAFVLIQHLDPTHASGLVTLLSRVTRLSVVEAIDEMIVEVDRVYVIPPGKAMALREGRLHTTPRATTPEPQRLIDQFLRSLADERPAGCVGVILSGTGTDGTQGLEAVKAAGGLTFAQDASASHDGMPRSAVAAGCVDFVLPPAGIATELVRLGAHPLVGAERTVQPSEETDHRAALERLFGILLAASGVDFSQYKQGTVLRRIDRRMIVNHAANISDYVALVESSPHEATALYEDILIHVTSFFREPEMFGALATTVFPAIVEGRPPGRPIRIWVPGCSTGEEVYSLAIALVEYLGQSGRAHPIKLFGTDVSDAVIARARTGIFGAHVAADVSPERLRRFFVPEGGGYQICKAVRELCVFARQDATRDAPFSKLDLISCRNVLIYLGPVLQARVLPVFHYALDEGGFLLLGKTEAVGAARDLFSVVDARQGIHVRRSVPTRPRFDGLVGRREFEGRSISPRSAATGPRTDLDVAREADRLVLARAPAGVLIDDSMRILQFRGDTGPYLSPAAGAPSHDILKMARDGLMPELRAAIEEARRLDATASRRAVRVAAEDGSRGADIEVVPLRLSSPSQRCFLVQFSPATAPDGAPAGKTRRTATARRASSQDATARVVQIERELAATKEHLQSIIAEQQASAEDAETANEEILSSNEELQSTNEELQTAKEELQATNEELLTVNEELQQRNREATRLSDDLTNLLTSVKIPIVMLGRDLRIRRFTPAAGLLLNLIPGDAGRPITDIAPRLRLPELEQILSVVVSTLVPYEREVQGLDDRWHALSIRPYRTQDDRIDGAVLSLIDIDASKRTEQRLAAARDYAENIVTSVRVPLVVLDADLHVRTANRAFHEAFRTLPADMDGQPFFSVGEGRWNLPGLRARLGAVAQHGTPFEDLDAEVDIPAVGQRALLLNARRISGTDAGETLVLLAIEDMTERRREQEERRRLQQRVQDTQKLESLGILAGGIAHDFNNILTGILGHANLAALDATPDSELHVHLGRIDEGVRRAADLCSQMLAYSGRAQFVVAPCDLGVIVRDATRLVEMAVGRNAVLHLDLATGLPLIRADATQILRVVMNLVVNAAEATGEAGGRITVSTGVMRADRAYLATTVLSPDIAEGEFAYVEVADEGSGMSAETLARIFDPFFTTKFTGRGLGLAALLGIVRGHEGALKVDSDLGSGSTFRLLLPCPRLAKSTPAPAPVQDGSFEAGGTILVIDDEEEVRTVMAIMLESLGFRVVQAGGGAEGIAAFSSQPDVFRLVLLDMTMPRLNGEQTFERLRALRANVRVVLMSGYSEQEALQRFTAKGLTGFLRKPFGRSDLKTRLETALADD
jgi:two-component system CheB/CheR fusion protein